MSKTPPIPPEQQPMRGQRPDVTGHGRDGREETTELQSGQPGDDDTNLEEQGRYGNVNQNTHHQGYQQDR